MDNENNENNQYDGARTARELFVSVGLNVDEVMDSSMDRILKDDPSGELERIFSSIVEKVGKLVEEDGFINDVNLTDEEKEALSMVMIAMMADALKALVNATEGNTDTTEDET